MSFLSVKPGLSVKPTRRRLSSTISPAAAISPAVSGTAVLISSLNSLWRYFRARPLPLSPLMKLSLSLILTLVLVNMVWLLAAGFSFEPASAFPALSITAALVVISWFYTHIRPEPDFASTLLWTMLLGLFATVATMFSYLAASMNFPLQDSLFAATDAWLGVHWPAWHQLAASHPALTAFWAISYQITLPMTALTAIMLGLRGRIARLEEFITTLLLAAAITILFSGLLPSLGPYSFFSGQLDLNGPYKPTVLSVLDLHGQSYIDAVIALREGSLRQLSLTGALGLITFPSFHTVMCVLMIIAMRGHRWLFPVWLVINLATLSAVPIDGGHYVTDMLGGAIIALISLAIFHNILRPFSQSPFWQTHARTG